jgi:hypothetical protein
MGKLFGGMVGIGLGIAWILVAIPVFEGDSSSQNLEWFGHLSAILILGLATLMLLLIGGDLKGLVVGQDNRVSTGKLQALVWTYAISAGLLSLLVNDWGGGGAGYDALLEEGLKDEYLILLGGPFAAAILAKGIVSRKAADGDITKTAGTPELSQAFSDDQGRADLNDMQYLLFNLVALAFFIGAFIDEPFDGFPEIPDVLVGLTGVAAATYVSNKAVLKEKPTLQRILPAQGKAGTSVVIFGTSLLLPKLIDDQLSFDSPIVTFNGISAAVTASESSAPGVDRITVTVPQISSDAAPQAVNLQAFNAAGVESNALAFTLES